MSYSTALVTGGSVGIGMRICQSLLDAGHEVVNLARRPLKIEHSRLHNFAVDLSDRDETAKVAKEIQARLKVTILVHNAGVIQPSLLEDVRLEDLDYLTNLHLAAVIRLAQAVLPAMKIAGFGRIVNISSRGALGLQTRTAYSATKSGMIGLTRTWALELAQYGITVNCVAPGPIVTDMFYGIFPKGSPKIEALTKSIPVQRLGEPADVARAVMFFVAPESSFITGQTLFVCGGSSVGSLIL
jgi:3-oxoacyl-[acyl-carrier protein] reductase